MSSKNTSLLFYFVYGFCFLFLIFQDAIYTPDTNSYLKSLIYRSSGYPTFLFFFKNLFRNYFDIAVVSFQLLFGFLSTHIFITKVSYLLKLNVLEKIGLLLILLFPFFSPLYVANNICSEGLSYPLYLLMISFALDFLFSNNKKSFKFLLGSFVLLSLTRGQFLLSPLIIAFIYILINRETIKLKTNLFKIALLLLSIVSSVFIDKLYHKIVNDYFVSTPFTYINASTSALYVSNEADNNLFKEDDKIIFETTYNSISNKGLILSSKKRENYEAYYMHFHNNLIPICNQTLSPVGRNYYRNKYNLTDREAIIKNEQTAKNIYFTLVKNNFNKYIKLFYHNIINGLYSQYLFFFLIIVSVYSLYKTFTSKEKHFPLLFLLSIFPMSNSFIVAFACHSIQRYIFYNYSLIFLTLLITIKLLYREFKN